MKLFGMFKPKAVPFPQFRDYVRQIVRQNEPKSKFENTENGFILTVEKVPISCNLRNLYASYSIDPRERDSIVKMWIDTLITEVPEHSWLEAQQTLRPMLKTSNYIKLANYQMQRNATPDTLPFRPFIGDLAVIAVREFGGTLTAVTDNQLKKWGVSVEEAIRQALNNVSMSGFPNPVNEIRSSGTMQRGRAGSGDVVGLVFEDNHLTATWFILERFRDHIAMRLNANYVVAVPYRSRLMAVRADEPGLVSSVIQTTRGVKNAAYTLTNQCYHVDVTSTGGVVTIYTGNQKGKGMEDANMFGVNNMGGTLQKQGDGSAAGFVASGGPNELVDFSAWGLSEPIEESASDITPWSR
jgi:hypothetical protein